VLGADGTNMYDSTAIADWLDRDRPAAQRLIPQDDDTGAGFITRLIDDYADEFLLYVVHHNRWVVSARDNTAGRRLAHEWRSLIGPAQPLFARGFAARQKRRLPYLFSTEVTRPLLDAAFLRLLDILETLLQQRPFILGSRFTLADAAIYGQLGMNLPDPSANAIILERAPTLHRWLTRLHGADAGPAPGQGKIQLDGALKPLLTEIARVYIPLMQQNARAHTGFRQSGYRRFNEAAFARGEMLYDGILERRQFRTVAKSFQARVWNDCVARYRGIGPHAQYRISRLADGLNFT
jgi:glutathione S-transferase